MAFGDDTSRSPIDIFKKKDVLMVVCGVGLLLVMVAPVPTILMDMLLAMSFTIAFLVLLVTLYTVNPVDFSVFPTVLLTATLYRLCLNVATTRLILLSGREANSNNAYDAGQIIGTFGQLVVGGDVVVGIVVFAILVTINFIVITKGAGRIAEVSARFTLDAMPGKQMAIDAELNQGLIDEIQAKNRREEIEREADFFGAMDGASKFIRGDAIAGIVITLINITGGILIGVVELDMPFAEALNKYTVLTIGDGLVGQIPALIVSGAAGLLVTRVDPPEHMEDTPLDEQIIDQLLGSYRTLAFLSLALILFSLVPGLRVPFSLMSILTCAVAFMQYRKEQNTFEDALLQEQADAPKLADADKEMVLDNLLVVEPLALELGVDLVPMVDERRGGTLIHAIQKIRVQLAEEMGLLVPPIHVRDNLNIAGGRYRILLRGEEVAGTEVFPRQVLAINPGDARATLRGIKTKEPSFGLDAWWIPEQQRIRAQSLGYTVVDVPIVISTHLTEVLKKYSGEIFSRQQLHDYLDRAGSTTPQLVGDLIPDLLTRQQVFRVLRNLLSEGLSVRDYSTILESLADYAGKFKDPDTLTEFVRQSLSRQISRRYQSEDGVLVCIGFSPDVEDALTRGLQMGEGGTINLKLNPDVQQRIILGIRSAVEQSHYGDVIVLCPHFTRGPLKRLVDRIMEHPPAFLSPKEVENGITIKRVATVSLKGVKLVS
jgi:flagellar biosynthesis protein FlhA